MPNNYFGTVKYIMKPKSCKSGQSLLRFKLDTLKGFIWVCYFTSKIASAKEYDLLSSMSAKMIPIHVCGYYQPKFHNIDAKSVLTR